MNQKVIEMYSSNYTKKMFNSSSLIVLSSEDKLDQPVDKSLIIDEEHMVHGKYPRDIVLDGKVLSEPDLKVYYVPQSSITDLVNIILLYDVVEPVVLADPDNTKTEEVESGNIKTPFPTNMMIGMTGGNE
jgi:hypothetical protein